jgi:hypothetical protein
LRNELPELGLHVYYPLCGEVGFHDGDAGGFQVREESIDGILAPEGGTKPLRGSRTSILSLLKCRM